MFSKQLIYQFRDIKTPFYYYDTNLLLKTIIETKNAAELYNYNIHYAIKANANEKILKLISNFGLGADCVSGNEIKRAIDNGFSPDQIVYAGVGKTDDELEFAIKSNIFSINCESIQEIDIINQIAQSFNKKVRIALRINPNIDAKTHCNITTGLSSNKFGISINDLDFIIKNISSYPNLIIDGIHFHIGSQITQLGVFAELCNMVNVVLFNLSNSGIKIRHINLGGGFGIDYMNPENEIPDFKTYFEIFSKNLKIQPWQSIYFEPGRSIVGQSGAIISRVLFVKENNSRKTIILDSGFTELLRPALYNANHKIVNLTSNTSKVLYDIAGPICETSDYFGKSVLLPETKRGDIIAILSAGAYGEVMSSQYNLRTPAEKYFSDEIAFAENQKMLLTY